MVKKFPEPRNPLARFMLRIKQTDTECWEWQGQMRADGYASFREPGTNRPVPAHRWSHERFIGPIPDGLQIDHLCRNTICVNPDHLEAVTPAENQRRIPRPPAVSHCRRAGHEYTPVNTYINPSSGKKICRACARDRVRTQIPKSLDVA